MGIPRVITRHFPLSIEMSMDARVNRNTEKCDGLRRRRCVRLEKHRRMRERANSNLEPFRRNSFQEIRNKEYFSLVRRHTLCNENSFYTIQIIDHIEHSFVIDLNALSTSFFLFFQ